MLDLGELGLFFVDFVGLVIQSGLLLLLVCSGLVICSAFGKLKEERAEGSVEDILGLGFFCFYEK